VPFTSKDEGSKCVNLGEHRHGDSGGKRKLKHGGSGGGGMKATRSQKRLATAATATDTATSANTHVG
jgi:hypothetical protein